MDKVTKKMNATKAEIATKYEERDAVLKRIDTLNAWEPKTQDGKDARSAALIQLSNERSTLNAELDKLGKRLEVETVAMLAGTDADFAEPTPVDALRNAS